MTLKKTSLWKHIARESLLGNRGLTKAVMVFLPWAVLLTLGEGRPVPGGDTAGFFRILAVVVCWILVSILANDLADRPEDRAAGKTRWINRLPFPAAGLVLLGLYGTGLGIIMGFGSSLKTVAAYAAASALGLLYSLEPVRFKKRGAWGILFYSLAGAAAYAILPWAWMGGSAGVLAVLAPAVFLDKWINVHFHQIVDYDCDLGIGTMTYAVRAGLFRARSTLRPVAGLAELWFAGVIIFVSLKMTSGWKAIVPAAAVLVILGGALYSASSKRKGGRETSLVRELPFLYLGLSYALFRAIPLVLMVRLAFRNPALAPAAAAAIILVGAESFFVYSYRYE
ncbi:MAG: UbiA family prenyltransferase [Candidatus Aminicenantales bacterium]